MEPNGTNQNRCPATVIQCRMGCGFYGSVANDNMCSKCYKEFAKAGSEEGHDGVSSEVRASSQITSAAELSGPPQDLAEIAAESLSAVCTALNEASISGSPFDAAAGGSIDISGGLGVQLSPNSRASPADYCDSSEAVSTPDGSSAKPKKNRCFTCRKRVGLTGFHCRCEGLFCSMHRYSDQHNCTFDYKEHGQEDIRINNPRVVSEKVAKI